MVEVLAGYRSAIAAEGEVIRFRLDDREVARVVSVLDHPLRLTILRDMQRGDETYSPGIWSRHRGEPIGNAAYHFRVLGKLGVASVGWTAERRGGTEHFYVKGPLMLAALTTLDLLEGHAEPAPPADAEDTEAPADEVSPEGRQGGVDLGSSVVDGATGRPGWAARSHGWILGEDWRLGEDIGGERASPWGVIWNATTGEVTAVQIVSRAEAGRSVPLGWVPRPQRFGGAVPALIRRAQGEGIFYLAGQIQELTEGAIQGSLIEAADEEDERAGWAAPAGRRR